MIERLITISLCLAAARLTAGEAVSGQVTNYNDRTSPIPNALVILSASDLIPQDSTRTDAQGRYSFAKAVSLPDGWIAVRSFKPGFANTFIAGKFGPDGNITLNLTMLPLITGARALPPGADQVAFHHLPGNRLRIRYPALARDAVASLHLASGQVVARRRLAAGTSEHVLHSVEAPGTLYFRWEDPR